MIFKGPSNPSYNSMIFSPPAPRDSEAAAPSCAGSVLGSRATAPCAPAASQECSCQLEPFARCLCAPAAPYIGFLMFLNAPVPCFCLPRSKFSHGGYAVGCGTQTYLGGEYSNLQQVSSENKEDLGALGRKQEGNQGHRTGDLQLLIGTSYFTLPVKLGTLLCPVKSFEGG